MIEQLERRLLLTTLHGRGSTTGGDVFEFTQIDGSEVRVKAFGNIDFEVVGSEVDPLTNRVSLLDLPGALNGQAVNGGVLTPQGALVLGGIDVNNSGNPAGSVGGAVFNALAMDVPNQQLYGLTVVTPASNNGGGNNPNLLEVVKLPNNAAGAAGRIRGAVVAEISSSVLAAAVANNNAFGVPATNTPLKVTGVTAAAFNPIDNRLFFVVTGGQSNVPMLFSIDVSSGTDPGINSSLIGYPGTFNSVAGAANGTGTIFDVTSMVWDQTSPTTARLLVAINPPQLQNANGGPPPPEGIFQITPTLGTDDPNQRLVFNANLNGNVLNGLTINGDNPTIPDTVLYGTVNTAGSDLASGGGGGGGGGQNNGGNFGAGSVVQIQLPGMTIQPPVATSIAANLNAGFVDPTLEGLFANSGVPLATGPVPVVIINSPTSWTIVVGAAQYQVTQGTSGTLSISGPGLQGWVTDFGQLYETAQPAMLPPGVTNQIENSPGDLTYDPFIRNPITGTIGGMVGTDTITHDLYIVSPFNRAPFDTIFAIYVLHSDASGGIAVGQVPIPTQQNFSTRSIAPFGGSVGTIRASATVTVNARGGTGVVYLGARTNLLPNTTTTDNFPILSGILTVPMGLLPIGVGGIVGAGLNVASGQVLGNFLFGGAVTGTVNIPGSVGEFYSGWLVPGNAPGAVYATGTTSLIFQDSFAVAGDIGELLVKGDIGTDPSFIGHTTNPLGGQTPSWESGFDLLAGGSIGEVRAGGSIAGPVVSTHNAPISTPLLGVVQSEAANPAWSFENDQLGGDAFLNDNNFNTPQYLGAIPSTLGAAGPNSMIQLNGELEAIPPPPAGSPNDFADYYGVTMLAGQTVTVQLNNVGGAALTHAGYLTAPADAIGVGSLDVGIFDPDGVLVASDYSDVLPLLVSNAPFQFTAQKPGVYRFAVAHEENHTFAGTDTNAQGFGQGTYSYTLNIKNIGDLAIGAVVAGVSMFGGMEALLGDIGAINATSDFVDSTVVAENGNLRCIEAGSIGIGLDTGGTGNTSFTLDGIEIFCPNGSVGLLSAYGEPASNTLFVNMDEATFGAKAQPIGGSYQVVSAVGEFGGGLYANKSIGTLRLTDVTNKSVNTQFFVGMDGKPNDGFIDLIDVTGQFGTANSGGPQISTGNGGDVRYMHVVGSVFRDNFFGPAANPEGTTYDPGESVQVTDDSGAVVTLSPQDNTVNLDATTGAVTTAAQLTVITYPIESGGSAIVSVVSTASLAISASGDSPSQACEIGSITLTGNGAQVINSTTTTAALVGGPKINQNLQPPPPNSGNFGTIETPTAGGGTTGTTTTTGGTTGSTTGATTGSTTGTTTGTQPGTTTPAAGSNTQTLPTLATTGAAGLPGLQINQNGQPLFLTISGSAIVDVFSTTVVNITGVLSNATTITNSTGGEMVDITAATIGTLISSGPIGLARTHTGALVYGSALLSTVSSLGPFIQQHNGVAVGIVPTIPGNILFVQAPALGNITALDGSIGQVVATAGGPGILGPIYAYWPAPFTGGHGNIGSVAIGGGIAPSGSGAVQASGVFADGRIGPVSGSDADIRGNIISGLGIDSIHLNNGSIDGSDIAVTGLSDNSANWAEPAAFDVTLLRTVLNRSTSNSHPNLDIGSISIGGNGGIIGSFIAFDHMGSVVVNGGYGIFTSTFAGNADGTLASMKVDGYGIRDSYISGGNDVGSITTLQQGTQLPVTQYSASVRAGQLQGVQFDPGTGRQISILNDLDIYLGTTNATPITGPITQGGIFGTSWLVGSRKLTTFNVYRVQNDIPLSAGYGGLFDLGNFYAPGGIITGSHPFFDYGIVNVGQNFGYFTPGNPNNPPVTQKVNQIDFGSQIGTLQTTNTIDNLGVSTGKLKTFRPGSDVSNSDLEISGKVSSITINGNFDNGSVIHAKGINGNIGTINILGNLQGSITAFRKISSIIVHGTIAGAFDAPSISKITILGSLQTGALDINGNVGTLMDTGDFGTTGQTFTVHGSMKNLTVAGNMNTTTHIQGKLSKLQVGGSVTTGTTVTIDSALSNLIVGGDIQAGSTISANPLPPPNKRKIGGQVLGNLIG